MENDMVMEVAGTRPPIDPAAAGEISRFAGLIEQRRLGQVEEDDFRRFRLQHGIYGVRGQTDIHMVRVKIPYGALDATQLDCLADIAEEFARGSGHLTTRQDIQLYWVPLDDIPPVLHRLAEVGLTTREASGNVVRNVTACPLAGVCATEAFDVTPYAAALSQHLQRNPICQTLPRKFKIAFSGCAKDCAAVGIHDLGALATLQEENGAVRRGFRLYVGGGLGATPRAAHLLEPFTPADDLILTVDAVLRVFDRLGNRRNRAKARLKFLVEELGIEEFHRLVTEERRVLWAAWPGTPPAVTPADSLPLPVTVRATNGRSPMGAFGVWCKTNVVPQKQAGFCAAYITVPGGDLTADQMRALASLLRHCPGVELRTTITQNLALRWLQEDWLLVLYVTLAEVGLERPGVHGVGAVVSCPGADTCSLALTHSHRLAQELTRQLAARPDIALANELQDVTIKISGCPNACGHYHVGTIGLYGSARRVDGHQVPHYQLLLGGEVQDGQATFGQPIMRIPARHVPEAILRLLETYQRERLEEESFLGWIARQDTAGGDVD